MSKMFKQEKFETRQKLSMGGERKSREKFFCNSFFYNEIYSQCFEFDCSPDCKFVAHFYDTQAFPWFRVKPMQILLSSHYFLSGRSVELQMNTFD